jgi:hypothetical protein
MTEIVIGNTEMFDSDSFATLAWTHDMANALECLQQRTAFDDEDLATELHDLRPDDVDVSEKMIVHTIGAEPICRNPTVVVQRAPVNHSLLMDTFLRNSSVWG